MKSCKILLYCKMKKAVAGRSILVTIHARKGLQKSKFYQIIGYIGKHKFKIK